MRERVKTQFPHRSKWAQNHQQGPKAKLAFPQLCIYTLTAADRQSISVHSPPPRSTEPPIPSGYTLTCVGWQATHMAGDAP